MRASFFCTLCCLFIEGADPLKLPWVGLTPSESVASFFCTLLLGRVYNPSVLWGRFLANAARKSAKSAQNVAAFTLALPSKADFV